VVALSRRAGGKPELRRNASVKNRSRSGPKNGQSGSANLTCCSVSEGGTAFGSVWPISIPELRAAMPLASKNHRGKNMDPSERVNHAPFMQF
jgi:hypothetical protein